LVGQAFSPESHGHDPDALELIERHASPRIALGEGTVRMRLDASGLQENFIKPAGADETVPLPEAVFSRITHSL